MLHYPCINYVKGNSCTFNRSNNHVSYIDLFTKTRGRSRKVRIKVYIYIYIYNYTL